MQEALAVEIKELEEVTKPIPLDSAIGRISRMDAINNRTINDAALRAARDKQKQLAATLTNLSRDDFGICIKCGQAIPVGRMRLKPHAKRCVQCAAG
ncbi:MAG: TraR/DksA family transcriptional regulator [Rhodothermales bacterium]|nr:TraR/DksA family transcriptional regulator [Rhodothermales bacterium]